MNKPVRISAAAALLMFLSLNMIFAFETGQASWYGGKFQGRKTANGEIFDTNKLTAAHKTLPFNTIVRVTNLENDRHVDVRINDRGPFVEGRIIDLSRAAAEEIDMTLRGVGIVRIEIISLPEGFAEEDLKKSDTVHPEGIPDSYTVQIASYSRAGNAQNCLNRIKSAGLTASIEASESGMLRVVIRNVQKNELDSIKNSLSRLGFTSPLVRSN